MIAPRWIGKRPSKLGKKRDLPPRLAKSANAPIAPSRSLRKLVSVSTVAVMWNHCCGEVNTWSIENIIDRGCQLGIAARTHCATSSVCAARDQGNAYAFVMAVDWIPGESLVGSHELRSVHAHRLLCASFQEEFFVGVVGNLRGGYFDAFSRFFPSLERSILQRFNP